MRPNPPAFHPLVRFALSCLLLVGCAPASRHGQARGDALASPPPATPSRAAGPAVEALRVPGFGDAVVVVPPGDGPWTVMVAAHANYDRPEYGCDMWGGLVDGRAFVLCPRGAPQPSMSSRDEPRFTYRSSAALNREIAAGLAALRTTYGSRVSRGPIAYAGFSLGSILAGDYLSATSERVAAVVLVEGGHSFWTNRVARAFAAQGGRAVVFACGQAWCARDAGEAQARLRAADVASEVTYARGAGHTFQGRVARELKPVFERVVAPTLAP